MSVGGLLMLGKLDSIHRLLPSFWVDYIEIPGTSYNDASQRYTFRMQEQRICGSITKLSFRDLGFIRIILSLRHLKVCHLKMNHNYML